MKFSIFQSSRQGGRKYNQDRVIYAYSRHALLFAIADGMGGHIHGEVAAQIVVQLLADHFNEQARQLIDAPFHFLETALRQAHGAILSYAEYHQLADSPRTTCVAGIIQHDTAYWAHVGDSRLYFFRQGKLFERTQDHSVVQRLFDQGRINRIQMATHPERNKIYNCLGGLDSPDITLSKRTRLHDGDTLLLCSDGLWGMLSTSEISSIIDVYPIEQAMHEMMDHAEFRAGENSDNISAVGITWGEIASSREHPATTAPSRKAITTRMNRFNVTSGANGTSPITEEDVERAIREIHLAIQKHTK